MQFRQFTQIDGLSDIRRLPRLGKIRLGVRKQTQSGAEYPAEVPYFVLDAEDCPTPAIHAKFRAVYGEKPTELTVMFPVEDEQVFFVQCYRKYGHSGLVCKGDGRTFVRTIKETGSDGKETAEIVEGDCPTPEDCDFALDDRGRTVCKRIGSLVFLLPEVTFSGTWQIDTSSFNSIVDLNSAIDYYRSLLGRISLLPLKLVRQAKETQYQGKKATHYPMMLRFPDNRQEVQKLAANFTAVREVFDIFKSRPQLAAPDTTSVPEDLYPRDVVREARKALPPAAPSLPAPPPAEVVDTKTGEIIEPGKDPAIDYDRLGPPTPVPPAQDPEAVMGKQQPRRSPGRPKKAQPGTAQAAGEAVAEVVREQREAVTVPATSDDVGGLF